LRIKKQGGESPPTSQTLSKLKVLSDKFHEAKPFRDVRLFIGIPTRDNRCFIEFATSLAITVSTVMQNGGAVTIVSRPHDCFVDVARNHLVKQFMDTDCTHLLMIDDDMSWNQFAVEKMILCDKEFIGGVGPLKGEGAGKFALNPENAKEHESGLWDVDCVGGAFCLLKREVIRKMIIAYPETYSNVYKGYHLFKMEVTSIALISEDYNFCRMWKAISPENKVWCYPDISFGHLGNKVWEGNFYKKLKGVA
jgi:hypothetical protein